MRRPAFVSGNSRSIPRPPHLANKHFIPHPISKRALLRGDDRPWTSAAAVQCRRSCCWHVVVRHAARPGAASWLKGAVPIAQSLQDVLKRRPACVVKTVVAYKPSCRPRAFPVRKPKRFVPGDVGLSSLRKRCALWPCRSRCPRRPAHRMLKQAMES